MQERQKNNFPPFEPVGPNGLYNALKTELDRSQRTVRGWDRVGRSNAARRNLPLLHPPLRLQGQVPGVVPAYAGVSRNCIENPRLADCCPLKR